MRVFDSSILIYYLHNAHPPLVLIQVESWITEGAVISVMSRLEVLGYPQTAGQLQQAMRLLAYFDESPFHEPVVQWTITLGQRYRIRLPDAGRLPSSYGKMRQTSPRPSAGCKLDVHRFSDQNCRTWFSPIHLLVDAPATHRLTIIIFANSL
jgi:hypothetical protein